MHRSTASQGSRRDARNSTDSDRWPRVGAKVEDGKIVVRVLADGEQPDSPQAVRVAEPSEGHRDRIEAALRTALRRTAASLADSIRRAAPLLPVEVCPSLR